MSEFETKASLARAAPFIMGEVGACTHRVRRTVDCLVSVSDRRYAAVGARKPPPARFTGRSGTEPHDAAYDEQAPHSI